MHGRQCGSRSLPRPQILVAGALLLGQDGAVGPEAGTSCAARPLRLRSAPLPALHPAQQARGPGPLQAQLETGEWKEIY